MQREENGLPCNTFNASPKCFSFSKKNRLKKGEIRKGGWKKKQETEHFVLFVRAAPCGRRICITVPRKIGSAVTRNRMRRVIREFFRLRRELFANSTDFQIIVKKKPEIVHLRFVESELTRLVSPH